MSLPFGVIPLFPPRYSKCQYLGPKAFKILLEFSQLRTSFGGVTVAIRCLTEQLFGCVWVTVILELHLLPLIGSSKSPGSRAAVLHLDCKPFPGMLIFSTVTCDPISLRL